MRFLWRRRESNPRKVSPEAPAVVVVIFAPDAVELIKARRKVQTRRVWEECRVRVGRCYSVQPGRGRKGLFKVTVLDVRQEPLGEISQQDAKREGFRFVREFEDAWRGLHGSWDPALEVWVVSFAVGDLRDRFDSPRLLAATPGRTGTDESVEEHQDYVSERRLAMVGEPEALTEQQLRPFVAAARERDGLRLRQERALSRAERERLSLHERVRDLDAVRPRSRELERELRVIRARLDKELRRSA